jgi:hypothetical protein
MYRLRVSENWVLRRIFGRKRDEVMGGGKELHEEELHDLYSSPSKIRIIQTRRMSRFTAKASQLTILCCLQPASLVRKSLKR